MPSISISRPTALVAAVALLLALVVAGQRLAQAGTASAPEAAAPLELVGEQPARRSLVVHVVGAVRRPGLLRLRDGARVADAVARAGGATEDADLAALNLAAPLVDGVQVFVPPRAVPATAGGSSVDAGPVSPASGGYAGSAGKPSLATATAAELDELPGVGPITAQKILDYRAGARAVPLGRRPGRRAGDRAGQDRAAARPRDPVRDARLRLALVGETTFPPRAPFFPKTWGTFRFPTPLHPPGPRGGP